MPAPPYLIDTILPSQEVHLLAGMSDAGKTRWLFGMLLEWEQGKPILGLPSHPVPWLYVAADRTERQAQRTLAAMGHTPSQIPLLPAFGRQRKTRLQILTEASRRGIELIIWEGFKKFLPGSGNDRDVTELLEDLSAYTDPSPDFPNGLTILGVVETPKMKPMERYSDPRQWVSGAAAWGYYSSTVFIIEYPNPASPGRILHVCPKQGQRLAIDGGFDTQGRLTFP